MTKKITKKQYDALLKKGAVQVPPKPAPKPAKKPAPKRAQKPVTPPVEAVDIRGELAKLAKAIESIAPPVVNVPRPRIKVLHVKNIQRNTQNRLETADITVEYL